MLTHHRLLPALIAITLGCTAGNAQQEADQWAQQMGIQGPVVCAKQDSDGNGYVSCTYKDGSAVSAIECSTGYGPCNAGGCRIPPPNLQGQQGD